MADTVLFVDNTYGSLASGIASTASSISLTAGHGARFPAVTAGQVLYATLLNSANLLEQIHVTTHTASSDVLHVSRAANGTVAKSWVAGDRIECRLTSEHLVLFRDVTTATHAWTAGQRGTPVALTSTSSALNINLDLSNNFTYAVLENSTVALPTNPVAGQSGCVVVTQNASAAKTLAYGAFWKFAGGVAPTLTTALSAIDVLSYYVQTTTSAACEMLNDVK